MIAVNQLAQGLFSQPAQRLGSTTADFDYDGAHPDASGSPASSLASRSASPRPHAIKSAHPTPSPSGSSADGTLLESADGSVMAECVPAGTYLLYWSPDQGFQADDVHRGPATAASVTFRGAGNSVLMHVTCKAGTPVAHLYRPSGNYGGSGGDD